MFINLTKDIKFFNSFESDYENKLVLQSCARLMKFEYVPKHKYVFKIGNIFKLISIYFYFLLFAVKIF